MRRRRETTIFSFAFLDILATTIGVLMFIMLMAAFQQSGMTEAQKLDDQLKAEQAKLAAAQQRGKQAEAEYQGAAAAEKAAQEKLSDLASSSSSGDRKAQAENVRLAGKAAQIEGKIAEAERRRKGSNQTLAALEVEAERARGHGTRLRLPKAIAGASTTPVHVDCQSEKVVILGARTDEGLGQRQSCPRALLKQPDKPFVKLLGQVKNSKGKMSIVLWIRPDGVKTANEAISIARQHKARLGYEPADKDWTF